MYDTCTAKLKNIYNSTCPVTVTKQKLAKVTGYKNIANRFHNFFVNIGPSLANEIPESNDTLSTYLTDAVGDTLFLKPVTQAEIIN